MARLVALGLFFWLIFSALDYSIEFIPSEGQADGSDATDPPSADDDSAAPDPEDGVALTAVTTNPADDPLNNADSFFEPGTYRINNGRSPTEFQAFSAAPIFTDPFNAQRPESGRQATNGSPSGHPAAGTIVFPQGDVELRQAPPPNSIDGLIRPGLYSTPFAVQNCSYELSALGQDGLVRSTGQEFLSEGRLLVLIDDVEPDWFDSSPSCQRWIPWQPLQAPLTSLTMAGNGDYWQPDLAPGTWEVPEPCTWSKVMAFRGASLADVVETGGAGTELVIDEETLGVRIRGCQDHEMPYRKDIDLAAAPEPVEVAPRRAERDQPVVLDRNIGPLAERPERTDATIASDLFAPLPLPHYTDRYAPFADTAPKG